MSGLMPRMGGSTGFVQQLCGWLALNGVAFMMVPSGSTPSFSAWRGMLGVFIR